MTQHTEPAASQPGAVPARIELADFIEAVTLGVARALAAQDEVSGYLLRRIDAIPVDSKPPQPRPMPPITIGLIFPGTGFPGGPDGVKSAGAVRSIRE